MPYNGLPAPLARLALAARYSSRRNAPTLPGAPPR